MIFLTHRKLACRGEKLCKETFTLMITFAAERIICMEKHTSNCSVRTREYITCCSVLLNLNNWFVLVFFLC